VGGGGAPAGARRQVVRRAAPAGCEARRAGPHLLRRPPSPPGPPGPPCSRPCPWAASWCCSWRWRHHQRRRCCWHALIGRLVVGAAASGWRAPTPSRPPAPPSRRHPTRRPPLVPPARWPRQGWRPLQVQAAVVGAAPAAGAGGGLACCWPTAGAPEESGSMLHPLTARTAHLPPQCPTCAAPSSPAGCVVLPPRPPAQEGSVVAPVQAECAAGPPCHVTPAPASARRAHTGRQQWSPMGLPRVTPRRPHLAHRWAS